MSDSSTSETEHLLQRAENGDNDAVRQLLDQHRQRLRQMVAVRLDPRLAARVDPSDVVQESLMAATQQLKQYLQQRPLPFYPWLRGIAWNRLVRLHARHVQAQRRSIHREQPPSMALSDASVMELAERLVARNSSPSEHFRRQEIRRRVRQALDQLSERDREVLVMRYLERLNVREVAAILELSEGAVRMRQLRALERLRDLLGDQIEEV